MENNGSQKSVNPNRDRISGNSAREVIVHFINVETGCDFPNVPNTVVLESTVHESDRAGRLLAITDIDGHKGIKGAERVAIDRSIAALDGDITSGVVFNPNRKLGAESVAGRAVSDRSDLDAVFVVENGRTDGRAAGCQREKKNTDGEEREDSF